MLHLSPATRILTTEGGDERWPPRKDSQQALRDAGWGEKGIPDLATSWRGIWEMLFIFKQATFE